MFFLKADTIRKIRHFNCGFCQDYLSALKKQLSVDKLDKRELMVIGCGHWSCIKPYKGKMLECSNLSPSSASSAHSSSCVRNARLSFSHIRREHRQIVWWSGHDVSLFLFIDPCAFRYDLKHLSLLCSAATWA